MSVRNSRNITKNEFVFTDEDTIVLYPSMTTSLVFDQKRLAKPHEAAHRESQSALFVSIASLVIKIRRRLSFTRSISTPDHGYRGGLSLGVVCTGNQPISFNRCEPIDGGMKLGIV